jgi:hypothetical protein
LTRPPDPAAAAVTVARKRVGRRRFVIQWLIEKSVGNGSLFSALFGLIPQRTEPTFE